MPCWLIALLAACGAAIAGVAAMAVHQINRPRPPALVVPDDDSDL